MTSFVVQFDLDLAPKLKSGLQAQEFALTKPPHTLFQGRKKGVTCTLYTSGKLVVQGGGTAEFVQFYLEPEVLGTFTYGYDATDLAPRIGVDESGKGDFFGPLCIAALYADESSIPNLTKLGVKDSKRLNDASIQKIAGKLRKSYLHHIVRINPLRYNELYSQFGNLNLLLGWGHATVIEQMLEKTACEKVIIDQFAAEHVVQNALKKKGKQVALTQRTKAEEDPVVAAASILARAAFLDGLEKLGKEAGLLLPKGASRQTVTAGRTLVKMHGPEILKKTAKLHFKTRGEVLGS